MSYENTSFSKNHFVTIFALKIFSFRKSQHTYLFNMYIIHSQYTHTYISDDR